jgi:hypothetical protein
MVYAEVMLEKHVNWATMTTHGHSQIIRITINIPTNVIWNRRLIYHAITNRLLQQGMVAPTQVLPSPNMDTSSWYTGWDHHYMGGNNRYPGWDDYHMEKNTRYMNWKGTYGNRIDSYLKECNQYMHRNVVDDTVNDENF